MTEVNLRLLKKLGACDEAIEVYKTRQENDPQTVITLLIDGCDELAETFERIRLQWANWFIVRLLSHKDQVRYAVYAAEQVIDLYEKQYTDDKRPRKAIEAAKKWIDSNGTASAAYAAANAAYAAAAANAAAANAAYAAADAAADAAYAAYAAYAADAADAAADAAAYAAYAAYAADIEYNAMLSNILQYGLSLLK